MLEIKGSQSHPGTAVAKRSPWEKLRGTVIVLVIVAVIVGVGAAYAWYTSQHAGEVKNAKYINLSSGSGATSSGGK